MKSYIQIFEIDNSFYGLNKANGELIGFTSLDEAKKFSADYNGKIKVNDNTNDLAITVELNNVCNLNCVYCYQVKKGQRGEIDDSIVIKILEYINKVYAIKQFKILVLRFIGGEPLLSIGKLLKCYEMINAFCLEKGIIMYTHIDSNGTIPMQSVIKKINKLDMVISLTNHKDHDEKRSNSYDRIIENISSLSFQDLSCISLRYNVSNENIDEFEDYLVMVKEKFPTVKIVETERIDDTCCVGTFKNHLSKEDFALWNSTTAIDLKIKHGFYITHSTIKALSKCQGYAPYSCKIYSDGAVTVCDGMYHEKSKLTIDALTKDIKLLEKVYSNIKEYNPLHDKECENCKSLIQCGGKFFCRDNDVMCSYQQDYNEIEFAKSFIRHCNLGNHEYFINMSI